MHESLKVKYQSTLFDSRCIIFGANTPESPLQITPPSNFRSQPIYYASETDPNLGLEEEINEFISKLFWILEHKRLERSREKVCYIYLSTRLFNSSSFNYSILYKRLDRKSYIDFGAI